MRKTRTVIHDAKHRYHVLVLVLRNKLDDDDADLAEHASPVCVAHDAVEEIDLSELARVVIGTPLGLPHSDIHVTFHITCMSTRLRVSVRVGSEGSIIHHYLFLSIPKIFNPS